MGSTPVTCLMCNKVETVNENEPVFEQTDVFVGGQDGVFEYRIPVLLTSNEGTLLAFCDARVEKEGDPPNNIDLALKRSVDGGKTWGPLQVLVDAGEGAVADSCGVVDRQTGTIWVLSVYSPKGIGSANAKPGLSGDTFTYQAVKSDDDGETWSEPIDITAMVVDAAKRVESACRSRWSGPRSDPPCEELRRPPGRTSCRRLRPGRGQPGKRPPSGVS